MGIAKEILISVVTSSVVLAIFIFFIKQYISKWLANEFYHRRLASNYKFKKTEKVDNFFLDKQLGIYPELISLTYKLKKIMKDGLQKKLALEWDPVLQPLCSQLTNTLFTYKFFLGQELFDALHKFKGIAQDATLLVDVHTREEFLFDKDEYKRKIEKFKIKVEEAENLFTEIQRLINKELEAVKR